MHSRMHPRYYLDADIFEREQRKIFCKVWLFAGLKTLLTQHNAFITRKIAGLPVVIQNFHGELRAFENVCLHRSALIQTEPVGRRPLVCAYHAWRYDEQGQVAHIPDADTLYRLNSEEKCGLKLRRLALRNIGNLLFINLDASPFPLEEQFSPEFIALLESSSNAYDTEVMVTTWRGNYNWKLAYENLRDANHPRFVHPQSLAKVVDFRPSVDEALLQESSQGLPDSSASALRGELRRFSYGGKDATIDNMQHFSWHALVERWGQEDAYYNWLAYPNLHIASGNGGHSFTIEHHVPVAPGCTDLEIYRFTAKKRQPFAFSNSVLLAEMHGSKLVVGEDIQIMEMVQSALHDAAPLPTQGAYESLNRLVERWYETLMETEHGV
ncbi:Rieske 2Fe-2S domain-containing protein [Delftia acidovorans]|uniref:aromatic ring-hydroxylating oxygenase subunit alpha n=1 Tax=Delftia acidovorans TaxID=80866 RepID=UPI0018E784A6|nr:Rieske 2Fe-2S domain-containing protein [Delftia acidovorans]MBJ2144390.1 Rieske 2Fe-2S domain-containing protein [Delftia acidovorans]